jgi:hypothetical protein
VPHSDDVRVFLPHIAGVGVGSARSPDLTEEPAVFQPMESNGGPDQVVTYPRSRPHRLSLRSSCCQELCPAFREAVWIRKVSSMAR